MAVMSSVGMLSRAFLYGFNKMEVQGLDNLLTVLDRRRSQGRERGLITVCNHVAVYGKPLLTIELISCRLTNCLDLTIL